jgi:hypothetical protein
MPRAGRIKIRMRRPRSLVRLVLAPPPASQRHAMRCERVVEIARTTVELLIERRPPTSTGVTHRYASSRGPHTRPEHHRDTHTNPVRKNGGGSPHASTASSNKLPRRTLDNDHPYFAGSRRRQVALFGAPGQAREGVGVAATRSAGLSPARLVRLRVRPGWPPRSRTPARPALRRG